MMNAKRRHAPDRPDVSPLEIEEIRLIADLRVMHAKVDELHHIVTNLKRRHDEAKIHRYADKAVLVENIERVDEIYLWFLSLKEEGIRRLK